MKSTMKPMQWLQVVLMAVLTIGIALAGTLGIQEANDQTTETVASQKGGRKGGGSVCGNSICEPGEDAYTCADCAELGNGVCEAGETWYNSCYNMSICDCQPVCGNGVCEGQAERDAGCADCAPVCGDGMCEEGEDMYTCEADCGSSASGSCTAVYPPQCDPNYGTVSTGELSTEEEQELYDNIEELLDVARENYDVYLNDNPTFTAASPYCTDAANGEYQWTDPASGEAYSIPYQECNFPDSPQIEKIYYGEGTFKFTAGTLDGAGLLGIDGNIELNGGAFWFGIIVTSGDFTAQGGGGGEYNFQGALLAQDTATFGGSFNVTYDSCAIQAATVQARHIPHGEVVAWRDM